MLPFIQQSVQFHVAGPTFLEKNVTSELHGACLEENFIPFLQGMSCDITEILFHQDGAQSHTILDILNTHFQLFNNFIIVP
jgi:hypothetical protein